MNEKRCYDPNQLNSATPTNEKPLVAERRPRRAERSQAVEVLMNVHASYATPIPFPAQETDPKPDFDTSAGRTPADRMVLALRYPGAPDAQPIAAVRKELCGRVYLLAVYDEDVLRALVRMGWEPESEPSP